MSGIPGSLLVIFNLTNSAKLPSNKHLQAYLNEFTFRFNRRKTPMAAFQTILGLASNVEDWPTQDDFYTGEWEHPNPREM